MQTQSRKYTLISPWFDGIFFWSALPIVLIVTGVFELFAPEMIHPGYYPLWFFLLVLLVDVSHVWWSLLRVLAAPTLSRGYRTLIAAIPIISFIVLLILAYSSQREGFFLLFQVLALIAAYHFIKQQIGITLLYARRDYTPQKMDHTWLRRLDKMALWMATGIPLAYWISRSSDIDLEWFVDGEFDFLSPFFARFDLLSLVAILLSLIYILSQMYFIKGEWYRPNPPKYLYILMTAFIWWWGIIVYESFVIFGCGVMLLHGIAYHGLVISSVTRRKSDWSKISRILLGIWVFLLVITLAYIEEFSWDQFVWREHANVFGDVFYTISTKDILPIIVAGLASIQLTHYILDRYIWRKEFGEVIEK